jgi:hypothetical protein
MKPANHAQVGLIKEFQTDAIGCNARQSGKIKPPLNRDKGNEH